jgi:tRNA threonylcarbamoyladenosine biosynthesis protein TsaB
MILFIDTSNNRQTIVQLDNHQIIKTYQSPRSQELLTLIDKLLKKNKKTLKDITEIKINSGPGSFTGLRVGCAVANTLSYALKIPINGQKPLPAGRQVGTIVTPIYE